MEEALVYQPEYNLLRDAYLGNKEMLQSKLNYLANIAQEEQWDYHGTTDKPILYNYLCYTYDRIKTENKIEVTDDGSAMCFNTGLLTEHGADIYAYFVKNENQNKKSGQDWFLYGFKQRANVEMRAFRKYPDIADYFTTPADFIYDKSLELSINYEHIINDNYDRFTSIGLTDKYMINGLLENDESKIQLLLTLFLQCKDAADLALVVDKCEFNYVGKTILTLEWAYVNSRRIVRPDVDWLKI